MNTRWAVYVYLDSRNKSFYTEWNSKTISFGVGYIIGAFTGDAYVHAGILGDIEYKMVIL